MKSFKGPLLVFLGACCYGVPSTIVKKAYEEGFSAAEVTGSQVLFAMLALWIFHWISKLFGSSLPSESAPSKKPRTKSWKLMLSGISAALVSIMYYQCVNYVSVSLGIILLMQFSWMGILIDFILFKKKPSRIQMLSIVIVLVGTVLASGFLQSSKEHISPIGIAFGLLAALSYSLFIMVNSNVGTDVAPSKKSALMMTGACVFIFIVYPPTFLFSGALVKGLVFWGGLVALFATIIPPLLYARGAPLVGMGLSSILSTVELPVAILVSYVVLNEVIALEQWIGVFIIVFAITLPYLGRFQKK